MLYIETEELSHEDYCHMVDYESFYFAHDSIIPVDIRYQWYQFNKYTVVAVRDSVSRKIVAHLGTLPLKDEICTRYLSGGFRNEEINTALLKSNPDIIRKYDEPGLYTLYCFSTAVQPDYSRRTKALRLLLNGFGKTFLTMAGKGIYISGLYAYPVTQEGVRLCKILNMTPDKAVDSRFYANTATTTLFRSSDSHLRNALVKTYKDFFAAAQSLETDGSGNVKGARC